MTEKKKEDNPSQEFLERKELISLQTEYENMKHNFRIDELRMMRENERCKHEWEMERQRIKSAEIRKNLMRKGGY